MKFSVFGVAEPLSGASPVALRQVRELGLFGLGECEDEGDDGQAAVELAWNAVQRHLGLHVDLIERLRAEPDDELRAELLRAVEEALLRASRELFAFSQRRKKPLGVGIGLFVHVGREAVVAHVGRGQIFLLRRDLLHRLAQHRAGRSHPVEGEERSTLHAPLMGEGGELQIDSLCLDSWPGDRLVLVSSALADLVEDNEARSFMAGLSIEKCARALVALGREKGAHCALGSMALRVPGDAPGLRPRVLRLLPVLREISLLAYCSQAELLDVAAVARPQRLPAGWRIFSEGDAGQELYLLVAGEVSVVKDGIGVARLGPGSSFGEMCMLDDPRRSATVEVLRASDLLVIPRDAFFGLLKGDPALAVKILWNMLLRVSGNLRATTAMMARLVGTGDLEDVDWEDTDWTV